MYWYNKKGEAPAFNMIIYAVLGLVFLGMFIAVLIALQDDLLSAETWQQGGCMLTNTVKCSGGIFSGMPSLCFLETREEPIDQEKFASLLRRSYWMFKRGECDISMQVDTVYPVYAFQLSEDINIADFINSLTIRKDGEIKPYIDITKSDLAYIESGTYYQTLCFDTGDEEGIANGKLLKEKQYYILNYDDPTFDKDAFENFLSTNTPIPFNVVGVVYANYHLEKTDEERGCLVYGVSNE